jgi:hypothetical protein
VLPEEAPPLQVSDTATPTATPEATPTPTAEATPTPSPAPSPAPGVDTSDWKTYVDPEFGFSLRYPPDLGFEDESDPTRPLSQRVLVFDSPTDDTLRGFVLNVADNSGGLTAEEWARQYSACHFDPPFEIRAITVDGKEGFTCVAEAVEGKFTLGVVIEHGAHIIYLTTALREAEFEALLTEFSLPADEGRSLSQRLENQIARLPDSVGRCGFLCRHPAGADEGGSGCRADLHPSPIYTLPFVDNYEITCGFGCRP